MGELFATERLELAVSLLCRLAEDTLQMFFRSVANARDHKRLNTRRVSSREVQSGEAPHRQADASNIGKLWETHQQVATLNCLVRNANSWIAHGSSLSLKVWRGYHVRRTALGGELHRLSQEDATRILQLPFTKAQEASTALSGPENTSVLPAPVQTIEEPSQAVHDALGDTARTFTTNKRGQGDFGF